MESVINKAIEWFKTISEATKELTSNNVSHKDCAIRGLANGSAEYLEECKEGLSEIRWQTGEPRYVGMYITTLRNGDISYDCWSVDRYGTKRWVKQERVLAWCKLSDIEPYKEGIG